MITINGWKFDFKAMMAYKDNNVPPKFHRSHDLVDRYDMLRISINYGVVFTYLPKLDTPCSYFFDSRYDGNTYDQQIVKAYTDWQFEQQVLLDENTDRKI